MSPYGEVSWFRFFYVIFVLSFQLQFLAHVWGEEKMLWWIIWNWAKLAFA